jgi:hypothetical protein
VNLLNPSRRQHWSDLTEHVCDISCGERHQRCLFVSVKGNSFTVQATNELSSI